MSEEDIRYASPGVYKYHCELSLAFFKDALTERYEYEIQGAGRVWTPHGKEPEMTTPLNTQDQIDRVLEQVPSWVDEVLSLIEEAIPEYDVPDLDKIADAADDLRLCAQHLGFEEGLEGGISLDEFANDINSGSSRGHDFTAWSGISGDAFDDNFGKFVRPTLDNQAAISVNLFKLYTARMAIISAARSSVIETIDKGAAQLRAGSSDGGLGDVLFAVSTGAIAVTLAGVSLPVSFSVGLYAGFLLDRYGDDPVEYDEPIEEIVEGVIQALTRARDDLDVSEREWRAKVRVLRTYIDNTSSAELELYDFTSGGTSSSAPPSDGFDVDVESVRELSGLCLSASEEYEVPIKYLLRTEGADGQLMGRDNVITPGDTDLKEIRDLLFSFLTTTCARYHEAAVRLVNAADEYFDMELEHEGALARLAEDPDLNGAERSGTGSVDLGVEATERDSFEELDAS